VIHLFLPVWNPSNKALNRFNRIEYISTAAPRQLEKRRSGHGDGCWLGAPLECRDESLTS
jgi:hypothetical protein